MAKNRSLSDAEQMVLFCSKYAITLNRETIWRAVKSFYHHAAVAKSNCRLHSIECSNSSQKSLDFGPRSGWRTV